MAPINQHLRKRISRALLFPRQASWTSEKSRWQSLTPISWYLHWYKLGHHGCLATNSELDLDRNQNRVWEGDTSLGFPPPPFPSLVICGPLTRAALEPGLFYSSSCTFRAASFSTPEM